MDLFRVDEVRRPPAVTEALEDAVAKRTRWMRADGSSANRWLRTTIEAAGLEVQECFLALAEPAAYRGDSASITVVVSPGRVVWTCDDDLETASRCPEEAGDLTDELSERWRHMSMRDETVTAMELLESEEAIDDPTADP